MSWEAEVFMKTNYKEKYETLIKRLEYLTSEEHLKEIQKRSEYPECSILGEIEAEIIFAKRELKWGE